MHIAIGDKTFDIDLMAEAQTVTKYKELKAIEKAFGQPLDKLGELDMAAAIIWTLIRRRDDTVRVDDLDFDVTQVAEELKDVQPAPLVASSSDAPSI